MNDLAEVCTVRVISSKWFAGQCQKRVMRSSSEPPPRNFGHTLDATEADSFARFIERLVKYTAAKIQCASLEKAVPEDLWFARSHHLLAHFSLDRPYLKLSKTCKQIPAIQIRHIAMLSVAHVLFNQDWDTFCTFIKFTPDGASFDEAGMVQHYAAQDLAASQDCLWICSGSIDVFCCAAKIQAHQHCTWHFLFVSGWSAGLGWPPTPATNYTVG